MMTIWVIETKQHFRHFEKPKIFIIVRKSLNYINLSLIASSIECSIIIFVGIFSYKNKYFSDDDK